MPYYFTVGWFQGAARSTNRWSWQLLLPFLAELQLSESVAGNQRCFHVDVQIWLLLVLGGSRDQTSSECTFHPDRPLCHSNLQGFRLNIFLFPVFFTQFFRSSWKNKCAEIPDEIRLGEQVSNLLPCFLFFSFCFFSFKEISLQNEGKRETRSILSLLGFWLAFYPTCQTTLLCLMNLFALKVGRCCLGLNTLINANWVAFGALRFLGKKSWRMKGKFLRIEQAVWQIKSKALIATEQLQVEKLHRFSLDFSVLLALNVFVAQTFQPATNLPQPTIARLQTPQPDLKKMGAEHTADMTIQSLVYQVYLCKEWYTSDAMFQKVIQEKSQVVTPNSKMHSIRLSWRSSGQRTCQHHKIPATDVFS